MSQQLAQTKFLPPIMVWKLQMAEERGNLEEALEELSQQYEVQIGYTSSKLISFMGPIAIFCIALVIGAIILSLYLPFFTLRYGGGM